MSAIVSDYLNNYETFQLFGFSHWVAILLFLFLLLFIPWLSKNHLSLINQKKLGSILVLIVFINYPIWVILEVIAGSFEYKLQLCHLITLIAPWKNQLERVKHVRIHN